MARHRNVRTMNYEDECYDDDDYLGHSVEDNYCISPGTAAQFTFNREKDFDLSNYMGNEKIPEEEEGFDSDTDPQCLNDSQGYKKPDLSDMEQGKLNSCLEEIRNILGDSTPDHVLCQTIIKNKYDLQASLNELLTSDEVPKPQRQPRQNRRNRSQGDDDDDLDSFMESLESESPEKTHFLSNQNKHLGILKFGKLSPSVESPILKIAQKSENDVGASESGDTSEISSSVSDNKLSVPDSRQKGLVMPTQPKDQGKVKVTLQGQTKSYGGLSLSNLAKQHSAAGRGVSLASLAKPNVKSTQLSEKKEVSSLARMADTTKVSLHLGGNQQDNDRQPLLSTQVTGASGTNKPTGLSLADLINKNRMDNKSGVVTKDASHASRVSLADLAGQRSQSKVGGVTLTVTNTKVSLSDLAAKTSSASKPASTSEQSSGKIGKSLADLANQHKGTGGGADLFQVKSKTSATDAVTGQFSGLSLADLAKSHKTPSQKGPASSGKSLQDLALQQHKSRKTDSLSDMTNQSRSKEHEKGSRISLASGRLQPVLSVLGTNARVDENVLSDQFSGLMNTNSDLECFLADDTDFTDKVQMFSPSVLAKTISLSFVCTKRLGAKRKLKFPKFSYQAQICKVKEDSIKVNENIKPFDFSTPSPDDIVKKKQNLAFTRSGR